MSDVLRSRQHSYGIIGDRAPQPDPEPTGIIGTSPPKAPDNREESLGIIGR